MHLPINDKLQNGRYLVTEVLGQGGFGITYKGFDLKLEREVCIKEFFMKNLSDRKPDSTEMFTVSSGASAIVSQFKTKFIKEAQVIATLHNPHIIRVFDVFEENGTAYYVMEYLGGKSLKDKVEKKGVLSNTDALKYIGQLCDALSEVHKNKIMHLDIKPSNIMLDEKGERAVLIDFGISKHYDDDDEQTSSTPVGRSKGYAPIEQYNSASLSSFSPATDIYSLGATLYYLLVGINPPEASIVHENGKMIIPTSISKKEGKVIETAMKPRKKDRYQSVDDFRKALGIKEENFKQTPPAIPLKHNVIYNKAGIDDVTIKNFDWYMWMCFPTVGLLSKYGKGSGRYLLSILVHPLTIGLFMILCRLFSEGNPALKNLNDFFFSTTKVVFIILSIIGFVGGILFPFRTKSKMLYLPVKIPRWFSWTIFSTSLISLGLSFDMVCLCSYFIALITWIIFRICDTFKLIVATDKKENFFGVSLIIIAIIALCISLAATLLFLLLLGGIDS